MRELVEKVEHPGRIDDTLTLSYERRQRSRQRVVLDSGAEAAMLLAPGSRVADGDVLRATDGTNVRVIAAMERVSTVRSAEAVRMARVCYHLGNRHVALQVGSGWVRYLPDHVLDEMVRGLGLEVTLEEAPYEPERGAYHGSSDPHGKSHDPHVHAHAHHPGHDHADQGDARDSRGQANAEAHTHRHSHEAPAITNRRPAGEDSSTSASRPTAFPPRSVDRDTEPR